MEKHNSVYFWRELWEMKKVYLEKWKLAWKYENLISYDETIVYKVKGVCHMI